MPESDFLLYSLAYDFLFWFDRGGKYSEDDAKEVMVQIISVVAYCHLQGVVHRDLKPEVLNLEMHDWKRFLSGAL